MLFSGKTCILRSNISLPLKIFKKEENVILKEKKKRKPMGRTGSLLVSLLITAAVGVLIVKNMSKQEVQQ